MKHIVKLYSLLAFVLITQAGIAQRIGNLTGINYQAVAIDEDGKEIVGMDIDNKPLYEKQIGVRFSITKGMDGTVEYQETQSAVTDQYGLFQLVIGHGAGTGAGLYTVLMDIPWIDADQWLKVEISTKNDGNYRVVSNQQFMSVPYSFYTDDIADDAITTEKILNGEVINEDIADTTIDLTAKVNNILPVNNGGTGLDGSVAADGQLLIGNGANGDFDMANLTAGTGINIVNSAGGITISSGVQGINSTVAGNVQIGDPGTSFCNGKGRQLDAGAVWTSPSIPLSGVVLGNIIVGSVNDDLDGCMMSTYARSGNQIAVSIYNPTPNKVCFISNAQLKVLIVQ